MKLKFEVGKTEKIILILKRNWFTGKFTYAENGIQNIIRSSLDMSTHFSVNLTKFYVFEIGKKEKHILQIKHTRPLLCAGLRPQMFEIKIDNEVVGKYKGY